MSRAVCSKRVYIVLLFISTNIARSLEPWQKLLVALTWMVGLYQRKNVIWVWVCQSWEWRTTLNIVVFGLQKGKYLFSVYNIIVWILMCSTLIFIHSFRSVHYRFQWQAGWIAIFLAWINFIMYLRRWRIRLCFLFPDKHGTSLNAKWTPCLSQTINKRN